MFKGVFAPIPTPFVDGAVAYDRMKENLARWAETPLDGVLVMGSNGESHYLTTEEKIKLVQCVRENFPKDRVVLAGSGCETNRETIALTKACADAGADGALILTPHFFKGAMTHEALTGYYTEVADAAPIPIMLYNMPRNTGLNMNSALVSNLAKHPNIVGIKDSGGNIAQISQIIHETPSDFSVLAGSGSFLLPSLLMGASGGVMAVANLISHKCKAILEHFEKGELDEAVRIQHNIIELNNAVTVQFGVPGLKAALDYLGFYGGLPRTPLLPLPDDKRETLKAYMLRAGLEAR